MNKFFFILTTFLIYNAIFCQNKQLNPYILTFFIRPLDQIQEEKLEKENLKNNIKNIKEAKDLEEHFTTLMKNLNIHNFKFWQNGVYAIYSGQATYSDHNGQITFSRKSVAPKFNLLLTRNIKPVFVKPNNPNTILGFVLSSENFKYYSLERKENIEKKLYTWHISEETILKDKILPYNTIIVFVDPKNFFIPLGQIQALEGENLVLPDIYFVNQLSKDASAFKFLSIRQYFEPVITKFEFKKDLYQQRIGN